MEDGKWDEPMTRLALKLARPAEEVTVRGHRSPALVVADTARRQGFWECRAAARFPLLAKAAVPLLSVHVTSAAAERNWSA